MSKLWRWLWRDDGYRFLLSSLMFSMICLSLTLIILAICYASGGCNG